MLVLLPFWALGFPLASLIEPVVLSSCCVGARRSAHGMSQAVVVLWGRQLVVAGCRCCRRCCWFVFGVGCLVFGVWCSKFGVWCLVFKVWCSKCGVWCLVARCLVCWSVWCRNTFKGSKLETAKPRPQSNDQTDAANLWQSYSEIATPTTKRERELVVG